MLYHIKMLLSVFHSISFTAIWTALRIDIEKKMTNLGAVKWSL